MASSLGSKAVHAIQKLWLIYCFQYLLYRQLYYFILIGHNSQRPQLSVRFGNVYPPCRERLVRFVPQSLYKICDVALKLFSVFFLSHLVNSYCLLAVQFPVALFQQLSIYEVVQACDSGLFVVAVSPPILSNFVPTFPPSLSTDDVSSERPLLRNLLPSVGITRLQQYYEVIRLPVARLTLSIFSWYIILPFREAAGSPQLMCILNVKHDRLSDPAAPYSSHRYDLYDVAFRTS